MSVRGERVRVRVRLRDRTPLFAIALTAESNEWPRRQHFV